jgi:type IV secretion system protein VirB7
MPHRGLIQHQRVLYEKHIIISYAKKGDRMNKIIKFSAVAVKVIAVGILMSGCTTAGPFVTNISSDGRGNLIVEKNTVQMNAIMGTVSSGDHPVISTIQIVPEEILKKNQ